MLSLRENGNFFLKFPKMVTPRPPPNTIRVNAVKHNLPVCLLPATITGGNVLNAAGVGEARQRLLHDPLPTSLLLHRSYMMLKY